MQGHPTLATVASRRFGQLVEGGARQVGAREAFLGKSCVRHGFVLFVVVRGGARTRADCHHLDDPLDETRPALRGGWVLGNTLDSAGRLLDRGALLS